MTPKSFRQKFSEFERFQEEASRMGLKNDLILRVENFSKKVLDPQLFIEQIVELRGNFSKTKTGTQIYQHPENAIFMDAQSSDLSGPLAHLWFGTPDTLEKLKKSYGCFSEIYLNDMCTIDKTENGCDRGSGTNWESILKHASSLLLPGGKLKIAPCGELPEHLDWDKLGFKEQSYQKIIHVQKHEIFKKSKPSEESKKCGIEVCYVFKPKNICTKTKKNDSISRWIHSNPSESFIRNPQHFFGYIEDDRGGDRAKELREILNKITVKDLEEFVGNSYFRHQYFLEENCKSLEKIRRTNGNALLQEKLFDILFPLIDLEDDTRTTKGILSQCIEMGLTERMKGLLKEKYKNKAEVFVGHPCETLALVFENTNIKLSLLPSYASLVSSSNQCIYSLWNSD
ncbi:MAG: hypothetical protein K2P90_02860 [Holosporales bacterium]|nr:hypothetical protein [Holosporales bacterium]